ncbi:hypothetical protein ACWD4G_32570 [Streptomyces sp. NPDC002643]
MSDTPGARAPGRREVLKYAGTTGAVAAGLGWSAAAPAAASPIAESSDFRQTECGPLHLVVFGDADSEAAHELTATLSDTVTGGLGQSARVLNPIESASYWGGTLKFDVTVSPTGTTYVTPGRPPGRGRRRQP